MKIKKQRRFALLCFFIWFIVSWDSRFDRVSSPPKHYRSWTGGSARRWECPGSPTRNENSKPGSSWGSGRCLFVWDHGLPEDLWSFGTAWRHSCCVIDFRMLCHAVNAGRSAFLRGNIIAYFFRKCVKINRNGIKLFVKTPWNRQKTGQRCYFLRPVQTFRCGLW